MVGNKKSTNTQKSVVKSAQDASDARISACMERSNTMQSNLQMHETLSSFESLAVSCGAVSVRLRFEGLQTYKKQQHNKHNSNNGYSIYNCDNSPHK
jgi:hypothetical protein